MGINRRDFMRATASFAALGGIVSFAGEGMARPNLRMGILSDIHVPKDAKWFEKALRYFDAQKVDGVLITGDLTTWNKFHEFETVASTWFKVFPDDRRSDGEHVERLFITGNHDVDGFAYDGAKFKSEEEARPESFFFHREELWRRLFREDYKPISCRTVKGYKFVLRNWHSHLDKAFGKDLQREENPTPAFFAAHADEFPPDKVFFYAQHDVLDNTVNAPWLVRGVRFGNGQDDGTNTKVLSRFPNCVAFTGHSHNTLTDEQSIWQGAFTAVNCSCECGFAFSYPGRENGFSVLDFNRDPPFEMPMFDHSRVKQGMLMDVFDDRITLHRVEFVYDQTLGPDWVIPLFGGRTVPPSGTPKYDPKARAAAAKPPVFRADAKVTVREVKDGHRRAKDGWHRDKAPREQVIVSFPPVTTAHSPSRGFDFAVTAETRIGDCTCVLQERRVFSPNTFMAEAQDVELVTCAFPRCELPKRRDIRFVVRPLDCWGNVGKPILSDWMRFA